jgi:hypothetical protein
MQNTLPLKTGDRVRYFTDSVTRETAEAVIDQVFDGTVTLLIGEPGYERPQVFDNSWIDAIVSDHDEFVGQSTGVSGTLLTLLYSQLCVAYDTAEALRASVKAEPDGFCNQVLNDISKLVSRVNEVRP